MDNLNITFFCLLSTWHCKSGIWEVLMKIYNSYRTLYEIKQIVMTRVHIVFYPGNYAAVICAFIWQLFPIDLFDYMFCRLLLWTEAQNNNTCVVAFTKGNISIIFDYFTNLWPNYNGLG